MWKLKYWLHVLKEDRGIGVVEIITRNSSANDYRQQKSRNPLL